MCSSLMLAVGFFLMILEPMLVLLDLILALFKAQAEYLHFLQCLFEVVFFLFEQLAIRTDGLGSMCQSVYDTKLGRQVVMTVPL